MSHNAYALFFGAVLIGCLFALYRSLWRNRHVILLVLRGGTPLHLQAVRRSRHVRVQPRRGPAFPPLKANICRI